MTYEVPPMFVYGFYLLGIVVVFVMLYLFQSWSLKRKVWDKETKSHKMMAGIREADGFVHKYLVPIMNDGTTVHVKGGVYFLPRPKQQSPQDEAIAAEIVGEERNGGEPQKPGRKPSSPVMFTRYPEGGFGPKVVLRYEEWDEGNPEAIRGFYGKWVKPVKEKWVICDPGEEGAKFIQNQLIVVASQLLVFENKVTAAAIGQRIQENEARQKMWEKAMANMPSKVILYILLFLAIVAPFIAGMMGY
jgi:hypothetical protein